MMKVANRFYCAVLGAALAAAASAAEDTASRVLRIDDLYRLESLSEVQLSPDGQSIAYLSSTNDREADEAKSTLWLASYDGKSQLPLATAGDLDKPRFSPDGRLLGYLSGSDERQGQLMLLDRRGGNARAAAEGAIGVVDYAFSPDGHKIALVVQPQAPKKPRPVVIESTHFKQDNAGYLGVDATRQLFLLDIDAKTVEPLAAGAGLRIDQVAFSPDGALIAFTRTHEAGPDADGREDIAVLEPKAGATARVLYRPFAPNNQHLAFSPDGKWLAFLQGQEPKLNAYIQDRLALLPVAGGEPRPVSDKLDRAVQSYAFEDAHHVRAAVEDDRAVYPVRIDLDSLGMERPQGPTPYSISSLSAAAGHTVMLRTDDSSFPEVYALEGSGQRKIGTHNDAWLKQVKLGAVEEVRFKSTGGEIHGLLIKPPDFAPGRKYPLLLWIHGGPNGQDQHALGLSGYDFPPQIFAAKGYLVLLVNYRGGAGRGLAFATSIQADWGHKEVQDLLAGVDHVVAQGSVDAKRLAIGGWSYGGILTDYTIASDRRFKAAIAGASSGNQISTYGVDQYVQQYNAELGPPWRNTPLWLKVSYPFFHADRITTPTLFLGGDKDFNVPVMGGEQMYQALKTLGVPARLVVYPGEHHVFVRPSFIVDLEARYTEWLRTYVN